MATRSWMGEVARVPVPVHFSCPPARYLMLEYAAACASTQIPSSPALETSLLQPFASPLLSREFSARLGALTVSRGPRTCPFTLLDALTSGCRVASLSRAREQQPASSSQLWNSSLDFAGGKGVGSPRDLYVAVRGYSPCAGPCAQSPKR